MSKTQLKSNTKRANTISTKQQVRKLLSSGKRMTLDQLAKAAKSNKVTVATYVYDLRSKDYAGEGGKLRIKRDDKGAYFVARS